MTEAGIDEIQDDLEVRINFANVTRDKQNIFFRFSWVARSLFKATLDIFRHAEEALYT